MEAKMQTKYLIIGSSHAGLNAADEIRVYDEEGPITMISMENCLPYSPTVLPYIISDKVKEKNIYLRDEKYFQENKVTFLKGTKAVGVDTKASKVLLNDGNEIGYEKLLVSTGSTPTIPPISGLHESSYHVLQTMEDAHKINQAAKTAKSAVILGTGLVGMHAAESLAKKGLKVELVRGRRPAVLPNYFDKEAGKLIHKVFLENGVLCNLNNRADQVESLNGKSKIILKDGNPLEADLLLVGTGVRSRIDFIANSGLQMDKGIVVDNMMRTSAENVWAAGDVAQADDFFSDKKILNGILPDAFEQGKIAGASMAGKEIGILNLPEVAEKDISFPYAGGISMNTFNFYENRAFSVGMSVPEDEEGYEIDKMLLPTGCVYQKMIFKDSCLVGFFGINVPLEPGIIMNIIRRKVDMRSMKAEFAVNPLGVSRHIMWSSWRG